MSATCVRVPVVTGHSIAVNVQTREDLSVERARELLQEAPGLVVVDEPEAARYPMAIDAVGSDEVFVGRLRRDPGHERALDMWVVADNLRKGAATNAVQIAEVLHGRGILGRAAVESAEPSASAVRAGRPRGPPTPAPWTDPRKDCREIDRTEGR